MISMAFYIIGVVISIIVIIFGAALLLKALIGIIGLLYSIYRLPIEAYKDLLAAQRYHNEYKKMIEDYKASKR